MCSPLGVRSWLLHSWASARTRQHWRVLALVEALFHWHDSNSTHLCGYVEWIEGARRDLVCKVSCWSLGETQKRPSICALKVVRPESLIPKKTWRAHHNSLWILEGCHGWKGLLDLLCWHLSAKLGPQTREAGSVWCMQCTLLGNFHSLDRGNRRQAWEGLATGSSLVHQLGMGLKARQDPCPLLWSERGINTPILVLRYSK